MNIHISDPKHLCLGSEKQSGTHIEEYFKSICTVSTCKLTFNKISFDLFSQSK